MKNVVMFLLMIYVASMGIVLFDTIVDGKAFHAQIVGIVGFFLIGLIESRFQLQLIMYPASLEKRFCQACVITSFILSIFSAELLIIDTFIPNPKAVYANKFTEYIILAHVYVCIALICLIIALILYYSCRIHDLCPIPKLNSCMTFLCRLYSSLFSNHWISSHETIFNYRCMKQISCTICRKNFKDEDKVDLFNECGHPCHVECHDRYAPDECPECKDQ